MKLIILMLAFVASCFVLKADDVFQITGYVDTYYKSTENDTKIDDFGSVNNEINTFSLNIAYLLLNYQSELYRSKIGLQAGDIPKGIYFQEPKYIQQANVGIRLYDKLWLDGGIMSTHIGGEFTHPRFNFLSSHSNVTFFEPTYQTGLKLSYEFNDNLSAELQLLNGNHLFEDNNDSKSIAIGVAYSSETWDAFYSALFGNEEPKGNPNRFQTYHNIYFSKRFGDKLEIRSQIDFATIDNTNIDLTNGLFYGAFLQGRYKLTDKLSISGRYSYFSDNDNVYFFNCGGYDLTAGLEYKAVENSYIRLESRYLKMNFGDNKFQFSRKAIPKDDIFEISLNFGVWFDWTAKVK